MSASGQMPSDYGQHWTPEANWCDFGPCGCGAEPGAPCWDRRIRHQPPRKMWTAHPGRRNLIGVV